MPPGVPTRQENTMPRIDPEVFAFHRQRAATLRRAAMSDFSVALSAFLRRKVRRLRDLVVASRATHGASPR
jgi:hypothetical protein